MKAIIYVGHGTRVAKGNEQLKTFIEKVKPRMNIAIQEVGFIELAEPSIGTAIERCVAQGATSITLIPVLLLAAGHAKKDLPAEIEAGKKRFPTVAFHVGEVIGIDLRMIEMLKVRLEEKGFVAQENGERSDVSILLVGRGSSDPAANSDFAKIARLVWEYIPVQSVEYCYLAATEPKFDAGIEKVIRLEQKKIFVLPYLLFTGILMKRMEKKVAECNDKIDKDIILCDYLGYHPLMIDVIVDRANEVFKRAK